MTIKERTQRSFPTYQLFNGGHLTGKVLDFGCGSGVDVNFLRHNSIEASGYDPYYAPEYPTEKFDTILCIYVLNVLLPEEQVHVLMAVSELLKPSGKAYFAVRRDIPKSGFRTHLKHHCKVYQCNVVLPYTSVLKNEFCEIYEYRHLNQIQAESETCRFCRPDSGYELLTESATVYALLEQPAVSPGHALIVPKAHVSDYFELPDKTKTACWLVVDRSKKLIDQRFHSDGYNIWISVGSAAGQEGSHAHIHLVPRYA